MPQTSMTTSYTRRGVIAGAATAFTIVKPESVRGSQANSKVSVGLIGSGGRGTYDATIIHADPRGRITAICDAYPDRIEQAAQTLKLDKYDSYSDFEKLLASPSIDAVLIATPPFEHPRMLEAAIEAKKHIYCEKPIGVDVAGCKQAIRAAKKNDPSKCISVGFQQRYAGVYLEAYKRLQEGQIGTISTARASWISNDPFTRKPYPDPKTEKIRNWFCYKDLSGDFIVEQDCHNLDVLHWFLGGLPLRAVGWGGRKVRTTMDILDHLSLTYEWPNGVFVNFEANQLTPVGYNRIGEEFTGTKGTIATSRSRMTHYIAVGKAETIPAKRDITYEAFEQFLDRIVTNRPENVVERSALSTLIAILGRTALYTKKEQSWKGVVGA